MNTIATSPAPTLSRAEAMSRVLAENWWALALRGAFAILFGILTFVMPGATLATLVLLFAAYMVVDGVFGIVAGIRAAAKGHRWAWLVVEGLVSVVAGLAALVWPALTIVVAVYLIALWSIVSGGFMTVAAFQLNIDHGRWLLALAGIFSIVFGILLLLAPITGAVVLTLYLGAYALVFGAMMAALAFKLRSRRDAIAPAPSA